MTTAEIPAVPGPSRRPTALVGRALGITQGQAATMFLALALALVLTLGGLPPVLRNRGATNEAAPAAATAPPSEAPAAPETPAPAPAAPDPVVAAPSFAAPESPTFGGSESTFESDFAAAPSERSGPATGEAEVFASVSAPGAPHGIAVGRDGTVYVAGGNEVLTFTEGGSASRRIRVPGQGVVLTGLALDGKGNLVALDATSGRVQRIDLGSGRQTTYATLIDLPACQLVVAAVSGCEPGIQDNEPLPRAAAFDGTGNLFVADAAQGAVWRIPAGGGKPALFTADAAFASGDGLADLTLQDGSLLVASPQALDAESAAGGAVYRIAISPEGKAGERTLVARFLPRERPAGLEALADGSIAVSLHEANAVVLVGADGAEIRRVAGPAGDTPVDRPTHLAFQGDTLLVTNQAADKANWAVLAVGIR